MDGDRRFFITLSGSSRIYRRIRVKLLAPETHGRFENNADVLCATASGCSAGMDSAWRDVGSADALGRIVRFTQYRAGFFVQRRKRRGRKYLGRFLPARKPEAVIFSQK